jgi:hypothetical protein
VLQNRNNMSFLQKYSQPLPYLKKAHKTFKGGPPMPFVDYTMLAHQWKKSSACWCKQPKTSMARGRNAFTKCQS